MWEASQHCQRFFEFAQWKKYFQVSKQPEQDRQQGELRVEKLLEELEGTIEEKRKQREIAGSSSRYLPNPWLDFVGWDEHLKGFKRSELLEMTVSI